MSVSVQLRQGLPRVPGGEPWPPAGFVEVEDRPDFLAETGYAAPVRQPAPAPEPVVPAPAPESVTQGAETETRSVALRRGLPRTPGGEAWPSPGHGLLTVSTAVDEPPAVLAPAPTPAPTPAPAPAAQPVETPSTDTIRVPLRRGLPRTAAGEPWPPAGEGVRVVAAETFDLAAAPAPVETPAAPTPVSPPPAAVGPARTREERVALRRGLPRTTSGEPWPPAGFGVLVVGDEPEPVAPEPEPAPVVPKPEPAPPAVVAPAPARPAPTARSVPAPEPVKAARTPVYLRLVELVRAHPAPAVVVAIAVVGGVMSLATLFAGSSAGQAFLTRFPGLYALPAGADPGFPAWVRWNHFLNLFFIVLIVRTGLTVHYEKKPPAYWTPKSPALGDKTSITTWMHVCLDLLWLLNGLVFVVLLFVTDHWMRIAPTSWEVFPNALSAALQYVTFDWPPETGWTNYNSLQQLAYFTVVFVAAPLAAATGFRLSGFWPAKAQRLTKLYPVELARAIHFPTMVFFVAFVVGHVTMVFLTGARANLNHMYAGTEAVSWTGFWILVGGLAVLAVAWELLRPTLLAPLANLMGRVSQR